MLEAADELWVAVGLINLHGLNFLLDNTQPDCTRNFLLGIDLPTDPKALHRLNEMQLKPNLNVNVRLLKDREFVYHPKMYLVRSKDTFSGFIGSANCTNGGLSKNIELTIQVDDQMICSELESWFEEKFDRADHLTSSYLEIYQAYYSKRRARQSEDEKVAMNLKERSAVSSREAKEEVVKIEKARFDRLLRPSLIDQARMMKAYLDAGYTKKDVGKKFSRPGGRKGMKVQPASNSIINITLSFLDFPKPIKEKIHDGSLGLNAAKKLRESPPKGWQAILERAETESESLKKGKKALTEKDIKEAAAWFMYGRL